MTLFAENATLMESFEFLDRRLIRNFHFAGQDFTSFQHPVESATAVWEEWWLNFIRGSLTNTKFPRNTPLNVVDLFASAGGLSLGIREAARAFNLDFSSIAAVDLDIDALSTYETNFGPSLIFNESVTSMVDFQVAGSKGQIEFFSQPKLVANSLKNIKVDLVIGGPPCQGHSSLNNHTRGNDVRNDLYLTVPAFAIACDANLVIIENVPRVVHDSQGVVQSAATLLMKSGYFVTSGVLSASQLGWPQTRSRHFLIASKLGQPLDFSYIGANFGRETQSLWWLINDLENSFDQSNIYNSVPKMSSENTERINWLFDNDSYDLPNHIRPDCHKDGHTYPSVYGRLSREAPSPTLTTGFQSPGRGRFIHPTQRRVLTVREAARIQGFPDNFQFVANDGPVTRGMLQKWIGDAVPSILGYVVGLAVMSTLFESNVRN